eukprot:g7736.t1
MEALHGQHEMITNQQGGNVNALVGALTASTMPVPQMPTIKEGKDGRYERQAFLREVQQVISLSSRPMGSYMRAPVLAAVAAPGDKEFLRKAKQAAKGVGPTLGPLTLDKFIYALACGADSTADVRFRLQEQALPAPAPPTISTPAQLRARLGAGATLPPLRAGTHLQRGSGGPTAGGKPHKDAGAAAMYTAAKRWALRSNPAPVRHCLLGCIRAAVRSESRRFRAADMARVHTQPHLPAAFNLFSVRDLNRLGFTIRQGVQNDG